MSIFRSVLGLPCIVTFCLGLAVGTVSVANAADMSSETRDLPPFNRIEVHGSFELQTIVGEDQNVLIETAQRNLKRVKTEMRGETLVLSYKERWFSFLFGDEKVVTISLPLLRGMELHGAGEINATGIEGEEFDLSVHGAADITLEGSCGTLEFDLNGAGDVMAGDLRCENVQAVINGVGHAELYASESVDAVLNGIGGMTVYGNPGKVARQINGLGSFDLEE